MDEHAGRVLPGAELADRLLEASVVGSFSKIGFAARGALGLLPPLTERLDGRVCWVTGGSSGLGLQTALGLARLGATLRLVVRDAGRGAEAKARIERETGAQDVRVETCDISSLASVRALAARIEERDDPVHVLVHNAGVLPPARSETADGIELTFATNVLGPYLLTELLLPRLRACAPARILFVTSGGMYTQRLAVDDLQSAEGPFVGTTAYSRSKRAEMALCEEWAAQLRGSGIVVHAMHPGWSDSPGIRDALPGFSRVIGPILRTPAEGVDTLLWLASASEPAATSGQLWLDRRPRPPHRLARTRESAVERRSLLEQCAALAGLAPRRLRAVP
jgi:NAD(P)-dependent dehydrogenase (short-subunit alcohol dehydrogenase family)